MRSAIIAHRDAVLALATAPSTSPARSR
jgi:hypothetical protein